MQTLTEIAGHIRRIRRDVGGEFAIELDATSRSLLADNLFNQLALDAAFERRARVVLELEGDRIRRVQSDVPRAGDQGRGAADSVRVTRISTQVDGISGEMIAEIFFEANSGGGEQQARTTDPAIQMLCHGAYLTEHRLALKVERSEITRVLKEHIDR
jgi:hypothetical protein